MKRIPLIKGQFALVDDEDFEELSKWKWGAEWNRFTKSFIVVRWWKNPATRRRGRIFMHRQILGLEQGRSPQVDHWNHITIDNRRENLRVVSPRQNGENRRDQSRHGVGVRFCPHKSIRPYRAEARINGKVRHLGYFDTATEAQAARDAAVRLADKKTLADGRPQGLVSKVDSTGG